MGRLAYELDDEPSHREPRPLLESLERDIQALLNREDIALLDPRSGPRFELEVILLDVQLRLQDGLRDARPEEDEAIQARMAELSE